VKKQHILCKDYRPQSILALHNCRVVHKRLISHIWAWFRQKEVRVNAFLLTTAVSIRKEGLRWFDTMTLPLLLTILVLGELPGELLSFLSQKLMLKSH